MPELEALSKKFKETNLSDAANNPDGNGEEMKNSMAGFFDDNLRKLDGSGTFAKKMSARRPTKKIDGTILNRHKNVVCIVQK